MPEEIQPEYPNKSTRSYEDWKKSLLKIIEARRGNLVIPLDDHKIKPFYDQGLMPTVAFNQLFN